jgi:hypothetical protein
LRNKRARGTRGIFAPLVFAFSSEIYVKSEISGRVARAKNIRAARLRLKAEMANSASDGTNAARRRKAQTRRRF